MLASRSEKSICQVNPSPLMSNMFSRKHLQNVKVHFHAKQGDWWRKLTVSANRRYKGGWLDIKMCGMPGLLYLTALEKPRSSERKRRRKSRRRRSNRRGQRAEPWGRRKGWKEELVGADGATWKDLQPLAPEDKAIRLGSPDSKVY